MIDFDWRVRFTPDSDCKNLNKVSPIKQKIVSNIISRTKHNKGITKVVVFGSASTEDCQCSIAVL